MGDEPPGIDPVEAGLVPDDLPAEEPMPQKQTEADRATRSTLIAGDLGFPVQRAIQRTLPRGPGERNQRIFQFARALKGIPDLADKDAGSLLRLVQEWHRQALPFIKTKPFEETWLDFFSGWGNVHTPLGIDLMETVMKRAKANPIPNLPYEQAGMRDLAALCRELQALWGDQPFYLATRTAGRLLGVDHKTACRWLRLLEIDGWIKTIIKGGTAETPRRATRFRFTGNGRTAG